MCGIKRRGFHFTEHINIQMLQKSNEDVLLLHWSVGGEEKDILSCQARNFSGGI